ncbi:MAG: class I SAM-dependent methyltransferase [Vicinamibacterales bacterium]
MRERVSLVEGDMRDWPGTGDAFDAVVIACCSVSHLLTLDDRRRTRATAFRLLRPGGVFMLDVRVPDLATLAEAQRVRPRAFVDLDIDATRRTAGEARLLRCTATTYEPHLQRADVRLLYDRFDQRALAERLGHSQIRHTYQLNAAGGAMSPQQPDHVVESLTYRKTSLWREVRKSHLV